MKTYKDMNAAERLAFEIWDNSIAGQDIAELQSVIDRAKETLIERNE